MIINLNMAKVKQPDTVFIQGLPTDVTPDQLSEHFGGIGMIKVISYVSTTAVTAVVGLKNLH